MCYKFYQDMFFQIWVFIFLWLAEEVHSSLQLNKKKGDIQLPIECSLNSDISFKFTNKKFNRTQTIAACSTNINSCYLSDKILARSYAIAKSDVGGILFIIGVGEDTFGTYTCYETYNHTNSAAVDISGNDLQTFCSTGKVITENTLNFIGVVLDGVQTVLLCLGFVFILCITCKVTCCKKRKLLCECRKCWREKGGNSDKKRTVYTNTESERELMKPAEDMEINDIVRKYKGQTPHHTPSAYDAIATSAYNPLRSQSHRYSFT
ncbi:uncharacterized protein LOC127870237 isoform X1 [Dreissena polymorpha]|uniref:Uncharacterized protein n=2 Tax=Dreissena polymorpha TaxID=45954 RepID=A0A9D4LN32_DREPO|nr:uncharacterized protein LOC127870237 isoform X1 [Dreissena polymorpha]KAH3860961.1 hypothetical protein DPMN_023885 [Dreissena polymorpha]